MKSTDWRRWNLGSYCKSLSSDVLNGTVLLLAVLSYNVGTGRLLGYGKHPKSRLLRKIESGDRNFYREFVSFCRYKGKVLRGLVKRRKVEFALFYVPWLPHTPLATFLCSQEAFSCRFICLSYYKWVTLRTKIRLLHRRYLLNVKRNRNSWRKSYMNSFGLPLIVIIALISSGFRIFYHADSATGVN